MKYYHPLYTNYYRDEHGEIFCEKYFDDPRGYHHTLNKILLDQGFWKPRVQIDRDGYRRLNINKTAVRCNRFCYECYNNTILEKTTKFVVDHINHIRTDDSIINLRLISQKENIDNEHRNVIVSEAIKKNRHGKNGDGSLEEYLSTPHTLSHFKRDIKKRGYDFDDFIYVVFFIFSYKPTKYMFSKRGG